MEHIFPAKTVAHVLNTTVTLSWGAVDIAQRFPESIIKVPVAMRLSCSTTATQAVYVGIRYETATKSYRVAERQTVSLIPPNGSVEITPASVAALGLLNEWITSITVELTSASIGNSTVTLIIDDDPPPLSNDPGDRFGLDASLTDDALIISNFGSATLASGTFNNTTLWYQVPAGKRFYIDLLAINIGPTGSYPADFQVSLAIDINAINTLVVLFSETERYTQTFLPPISTALVAGDRIRTIVDNFSASNVNWRFSLIGREVF